MSKIGNFFYGCYTKVDQDLLDRSGQRNLDWGNVPSIHEHNGDFSSWTSYKSAANVAASIGSGSFQTATNTGSITLGTSLVTGSAIALSATGIGAIAVAGALAVGQAGAAGVSAYKTHQHIKNLQEIQVNFADYDCDGCMITHHDILTNVLPYIINKKRTKRRRKAESTVPLLGSGLVMAETGVKSIYKRISGSRGRQRHIYAERLAAHMVSCTCELSQAIVAELWSHDEMLALRAMNSNDCGPWIQMKMASQ